MHLNKFIKKKMGILKVKAGQVEIWTSRKKNLTVEPVECVRVCK